MRDKTERPEALEAGTVKLVGTDVEKIVSNVALLLTNDQLYQKISYAQNPYGDGKASERIVNVLAYSQGLVNPSRDRKGELTN